MSRTSHRQLRSIRSRRRRFSRRRLTQVLLALIGLLPITYPLAQGQGEDVVATQSPASSS